MNTSPLSRIVIDTGVSPARVSQTEAFPLGSMARMSWVPRLQTSIVPSTVKAMPSGRTKPSVASAKTVPAVRVASNLRISAPSELQM